MGHCSNVGAQRGRAIIEAAAAENPASATMERVATWRAQGYGPETIRRWLGLTRRDAAMIGLDAGGPMPREAEQQGKVAAPAAPITLDDAVAAICHVADIRPAELRRPERDTAASRARQALCFLAMESGLSSVVVAERLGRSAAAVRVSAQRFRIRNWRDPRCRDLYRRATQLLRAAGSSRKT